MAFDGSKGSPIASAEAGNWTREHREQRPGQPMAHFFGRDILGKLLAQVGCEGIRFYYGLDNGAPQLLAVGADSAENDQLGDGFIVADDSATCPTSCSRPNVLNS